MISGVNGYSSSRLLAVLTDKKDQLEDLTIQLGSGKKATSYSGLRDKVGVSLDLRSQLSEIEGYQAAITQTNLRTSLMNLSLQRLVEIGSEVSGSATATSYNISAEGKSVGQLTAATLVSEALGLLDAELDGDYLFSGKTTDVSPTRNYDQIVYGFDGADGLLTVTDERIRADAGADDMGRLTVSTTGSIMTLAEQATDFGYKLDSVGSNLSNANITGPAGSPSSVSVELTAAPEVGEVISFTFTLPDGSSEVIALKAVNGSTMPGDGTFSLMGTTDNIAQAIEDELAFQIKKNVTTEGEASSRIQAAMDFYMTSGDGEPMRVVGSTPETATSLDTATAAGKPTVEWYIGDNDNDSARDTAKSQIDKGLSVSVGARANEDGIARQLAYMTAFSLPTYDEDSSVDKNRYSAFADAISSGLSSNQQGDVVATIQMEIGVASKIAEDADDRHVTKSSLLKTMSHEVDGIDNEEVAAKIMSLNATIEASYQATSMLYQLSLTRYI